MAGVPTTEDPKAEGRTTERILQLLEKQSKRDNEPPTIVWLDTLLPTIITVSTFGGSITFTLVPTEPRAPTTRDFTQDDVTSYLALAWLFFLLSLGFAVAATLIIAFARVAVEPPIEPRHAGEAPQTSWTDVSKMVLPTLSLLSLLLLMFTLLAFLFLGLVVVAYSKVVGAVAVSITGIFIIVAIGLWFRQLYLYIKESKKA